MTVVQTARTWTIARIFAGLLGAYFVYSTVSGLISLLSIGMGGKPLEVVIVFATSSAASGISSIILILFMLRGHLPASRRQAGIGCVSLLLASLASMGIAALVIAILNLEAGLEAVLRLAIVYSGGALGGGLGLYLARPSAVTLLNKGIRAEDREELVGSADQAKNTFPPKPAPSPNPVWLGSVIAAAVTAFIASIFGCFLTCFSFLLSPCIPSEAGTDSGAALAVSTISMLLWLVATPLAVLLGGALGYGTSRYLNLHEIKATNQLPAFFAGGFSGLVFTIITLVLFQKLLCSG